MKHKVYISGKISGKEQEAQIAFFAIERLLTSCGFEPVNPFKNGLTEDDTWERHLAVDIIALLECDAILQLPGWEDSRGARLEYEIAKLKRIPIAVVGTDGIEFKNISIREIYNDRIS